MGIWHNLAALEMYQDRSFAVFVEPIPDEEKATADEPHRTVEFILYRRAHGAGRGGPGQAPMSPELALHVTREDVRAVLAAHDLAPGGLDDPAVESAYSAVRPEAARIAEAALVYEGLDDQTEERAAAAHSAIEGVLIGAGTTLCPKIQWRIA